MRERFLSVTQQMRYEMRSLHTLHLFEELVVLVVLLHILRFLVANLEADTLQELYGIYIGRVKWFILSR